MLKQHNKHKNTPKIFTFTSGYMHQGWDSHYQMHRDIALQWANSHGAWNDQFGWNKGYINYNAFGINQFLGGGGGGGLSLSDFGLAGVSSGQLSLMNNMLAGIGINLKAENGQLYFNISWMEGEQIDYRDNDGYIHTTTLQVFAFKRVVVGMGSGEAENSWGNSWAVKAAAGYMLALQADLVSPDPTDAAWPKWVGHAVIGTISAIILYYAGKSILNPNLEGTTTSRGNPTDWNFDPKIIRLQNDKYYPPSSNPPKWFWPAIGAAGAYELYKNWPKPNIPQPTTPIDNTYVVPSPIYPYPYGN